MEKLREPEVLQNEKSAKKNTIFQYGGHFKTYF